MPRLPQTPAATLAAVLEKLKVASGARVADIKLVLKGLQRKERSGALPPNKGWVFAAQEAKTALGMARLAGFPCRSEFAEKQMEAATKRAATWLKKAAA